MRTNITQWKNVGEKEGESPRKRRKRRVSAKKGNGKWKGWVLHELSFVRTADSFTSFRSQLKTYMFARHL